MNLEKSSLQEHALVSHNLGISGEAWLTDEEIHARRRRRVENLIYFCWGLIALKSFLVVWAVHYFSIPFNPFWVIGPTVTFALVASVAYFWMRE